MKEVELFETVFISGVLGANQNKISKKFDLEFPVDEIILKYVSIYDNGAYSAGGALQSPPTTYIKSSMLGVSDILCSYPATFAFHESFNIPFKPTSKYIKGIYDFTFFKPDNSLIGDGNTDLTVNICMLFIKYKDSK